MKIQKIKNIGLGILASTTMLFTSCLNDLDVLPQDPDNVVAQQLYTTKTGYEQVLAKVYAGLSLTGQKGPAGDGDVGGIDEGTSSYIRNLWNAQVLVTDEAICAWGDFGVSELNNLKFSPANPFMEGLYYRLYNEIAMSNEFLRQSTDANLDARGQSNIKDDIKVYRAEARFIRAYSYWVLMDVFGNVPFVTEEMGVGTYLPQQKMRGDLYDWLITEVEAFTPDMLEAMTAPYGRVDKGAAWMLMAKIYLNAEVYKGTSVAGNWDKVVEYTTKVNDAYTFYTGSYKHLFYADNNNATVRSGFIFTIPYDGDKMQTYGGTNFLAFSATGGEIAPDAIGLSGGWGGNRARPQLIDRFSTGDFRGYVEPKTYKTVQQDGKDVEVVDKGFAGMFFDSGKKAVDNPAKYSDGYGVMKFRNIAQDPTNSPSNKDFVTTDFPMFRLADSYLMYAEAVVRGATFGTRTKALELLNKIRTRAYGDASGAVTDTDLNTDFILDERGRELFWECSRRTDLIRFNKFTSSDYVWEWKGGSKSGSGVNRKYRLFPLPGKDVGANTNLNQNSGY
ncbi:RagB/SusD family nutrient uptake outer membrane protein [Halosquirtibacter xylanolyticus]|uniref:RagB/SusD family nutrient uptake outer membrane protein n=1 Tax=Halosquirtibacter xylanolyticus TaxID=3374599 RepID=UPI0037480D4C|nr:RagB/SusD family nutrient uptake outer membrane protein [Prolixibacteraceae bacterium]